MRGGKAWPIFDSSEKTSPEFASNGRSKMLKSTGTKASMAYKPGRIGMCEWKGQESVWSEREVTPANVVRPSFCSALDCVDRTLFTLIFTPDTLSCSQLGDSPLASSAALFVFGLVIDQSLHRYSTSTAFNIRGHKDKIPRYAKTFTHSQTS